MNLDRDEGRLEELAESRRLAGELEEAKVREADLRTALRNFCSQCGQTYDDPACGIAHIALQSLRRQVRVTRQKVRHVHS